MKHINSVNNIDNLRAQVRHDLRELGIKVPKPKKAKRAAARSNQDVVKSSIFGNYLATVHCVYIPDCGYVAKFLVDAAEIIRSNIDDEGIFRKSGAVSRQKELKQQLDCGKGLVGANVHDVTALVKQFFRELPEPLFTSVYHDTFVRCYQMENQDMARKAILLLCLLLPGEHISTLRFTMKLLAGVAEHSANNKMDSTNLSVVLAPNIMHVNSKSETMKSCEEKLLQVQTSVVDMLINHADEVGMVNVDLAERTAFMSEVFSTDDELDASEDNLEETHEKKRKEKKRKRSGSFQGFVSSIAQSITKWRRSTDGKTNTSAVSQASYNSQINSSQTNVNEKSEGTGNKIPAYQFSVTEATPVVRRKKAMPGTEGRAFSENKKKAILNQLPQHSALASTPFTPATGVRRMDLNSMKRGQLETPSIPPRPYPCTPRHSMKTPRKKIALFSPASTTKKKRYSSTTNLSMQSASKKTTKSKGIFRRLSGSKGDQAFPAVLKKGDSSHQIGQRLASPTSSVVSTTTNDSICSKTGKHISDESPIAAIAQTSSFSTSLCEQSVLSSFEDDRRSLNDGFIGGMEEREVDISRIMSEPVISGAFEQGEYVRLGDVCPRETLSDTMIFNFSSSETPRRHNRSFSLDGTLDSSTRKSSLRRGQPNSIKAGLLQGDQREVQKLRRSFGLDKSDIGFPVPFNTQTMIDEGQYVHLDDSFNDYLDTQHNEPSYASLTTYEDDVEMKERGNAESGDDVPKKTDEQHVTESNESEENNTNQTNTADVNESDNPGDTIKKTLAQQKQESKDSLLSQTSSVISPVTYIKEREMTRSISADSGKGSMCEEPMDEVTTTESSSSVFDQTESTTTDSCTSSVFDRTDTTTTASVTTVFDQTDTTTTASVTTVFDQTDTTTTASVTTVFDQTKDTTQIQDISFSEVQTKKDIELETSNLANYGPGSKKSVSTQDLVREVETPTRVSRSKSLLEGSFRKNNIRPNLQISAETHKLLARAGYISEQKAEKPNEDFDDFAVPGNIKFPIIKDAEAINPRRESIIALQKNNAGYVKNNIFQFNKISETKKVDDKFSSPLRFPNSTSRKRGMSPLRLSKIETDTDYLKLAMNTSFDTSIGIARVPISTQMIKPSDPTSLKHGKGSSLKRKPSIYYAEKDGAGTPGSVGDGRGSSNNTILEEEEGNSTTTDDGGEDHTQTDSLVDSVFISDNNEKKKMFDLQDTIVKVCTPRGEKLKQTLDKTCVGNKENAEGSPNRKMPEIKQAILTTPITLEKISLRTASNKTPLEVFKTSKSPRSPAKPLKRLGSSPHSPRSRGLNSPKLVKNRRSLLSSMPIQNEEF